MRLVKHIIGQDTGGDTRKICAVARKILLLSGQNPAPGNHGTKRALVYLQTCSGPEGRLIGGDHPGETRCTQLKQPHVAEQDRAWRYRVTGSIHTSSASAV